MTRRLPNRLEGTLGTDDLHHRVTVDAPTLGIPAVFMPGLFALQAC